MNSVYGITNSEGYPLTDGISHEVEARRMAQNLANERGEPVELCKHEVSNEDPWPDGEVIEPDTSGTS